MSPTAMTSESENDAMAAASAPPASAHAAHEGADAPKTKRSSSVLLRGAMVAVAAFTVWAVTIEPRGSAPASVTSAPLRASLSA